MEDTYLFFTNLLAWLFIIGVCLSIVFSIAIFAYFRTVLERERKEYREDISRIRDLYEMERKELMDRFMANSYSEYKAYQEETNVSKTYPSQETNYIKRNIDTQNAMFDEDRQGYQNE